MLTGSNQPRRSLSGTAPTALLFPESRKVHVPESDTRASELLIIMQEASELSISHHRAHL